MNILIVNYQLDENHGALAWQALVVKRLANICSKVTVISENIGKFKLPENVQVIEIPKRPFGWPVKLGGRYLYNLTVYRICKTQKIDACFIHMAHQWTYILWPVLKLLNIPRLLWYAHGNVTTHLKLAVKAANIVITSTPEGCRINSSKIEIIGQGIDTDLFDIPKVRDLEKLISIGRISERKRILLIIEVMHQIKKTNNELKLDLVGPILTVEDLQYFNRVNNKVWEMGIADNIQFSGSVPIEHIPSLYKNSFLHLNLSYTNSMDKTVMESLACGCPVLTSNPAFRTLLSDYPEMYLETLEPTKIAERIVQIYLKRHHYDANKLRALVSGHHDLSSYANKIKNRLELLVGSKVET